jgi:pimeloyl-ACP methyl ester carboxylesterase
VYDLSSVIPRPILGRTLAPQPYAEIFFTARDGLRLYGRHYPAPGSARRPVLCLAGLTRNSRDFHELAIALSGSSATARDVYTLDSRGRGRSAHDPNWKNYSVPVEMGDVLDFMTMTGLHDAAIVGTSRGGLIAFMMAAARPAAIGALVLNDIGPVLERPGLARIIATVGRVPRPVNWPEATRVMKELNARQFPGVSDADWEAVTRQWFNDDGSRPVPGYDANIARSIALPSGPLPVLWPQYAALARIPILALRGEHSDILSAATLEQMRLRHPHCEAVTVLGQGHAPLLRDQPAIDAIGDFLARADTARASAAA